MPTGCALSAALGHDCLNESDTEGITHSSLCANGTTSITPGNTDPIGSRDKALQSCSRPCVAHCSTADEEFTRLRTFVTVRNEV